MRKKILTEQHDRLLAEERSLLGDLRMTLARHEAHQSDGSLMNERRFPDMEKYPVETLDQAERVRLKSLNPLGVGLSLADKSRAATQERLDILADDIAALDSIEHQLAHYREDLRRGHGSLHPPGHARTDR